MRLLALAALAISAQAAPIPCFTVGPVVFTNCQTINTASPGLPIMGFNFVPDIYPDPLFTVPPGTPDSVILFVPGEYTLDNFFGVQSSVSETLTADFTVAAGYAVRGIGMVGKVADGGSIAVGENILLNLPCLASVSHDTFGGGCSLPTPLQSGTLSVTLEIHGNTCGGGPCHGLGQIHLSHVLLALQQVPVAVPEPGTWLLVGLGLALTARLRRVSGPLIDAYI